MIIVRNKLSGLILPGQFPALCIWPFIFIRHDTKLSIEDIVQHERIHARQQLEMAWIFFFLWYLVEFLIRYAFLRNFIMAYQHLSHEREAYANEGNLHYLKTRKCWGFLKYL